MAKAVRFLYANQAEGGTCDATDEATGFPAASAIDLDRSTIWKASTAYTSGFLRVDLGSAKAITGMGLANHNIGTLTGTQKLQYSDNNSSWSDQATIAPAATGDYYVTFASSSHRYWRLLLNSTGAERAYVGEFYLGTSVEMATNPDLGLDEEDVWQTLQSGAISGRKVVKETGRQTRLFRFKWDYEATATKDQVRTVLLAQSGDLKPFFYIPRVDGSSPTEGSAYYVRLAANRWKATERVGTIYGWELVLEEQT